MMHTIFLKNNKNFSCEDDKTILQAAQSSGIHLEHSCSTGRCRSCMVQILEGDVRTVKEDTVLSSSERAQGYVLSCTTQPRTDLKLNTEDLGDIELIKPQTIPCKVDSIENVGPDVMEVILRLPPNTNFIFEAGQYVNIIKGKIKRSYSIANNVKEKGKLHFFIKNYKGGEMSQYWFHQAKKNDLLRLEGPLGTFFYRNNGIEDIIMLATGTGIAPIKAMLEKFKDNPELHSNKKISVFWGARNSADLFWRPSFDLQNMDFIPVLSRENGEWTGEKGYVQNVLLQKIKNLPRAQVYACGSNEMINSAKNLLIKKGLPEDQFFSDAFVCSN